MKNRISKYLLIFSLITAAFIYLIYPSQKFNADAMHYNILSFSSANNFLRLLSDESVPVHFLWHIIMTYVSRLAAAENLYHNLIILQSVNIVISLFALFFFAFFIRKISGDLCASVSTVCFAFSNAASQYFLSLEVYSLNSLIVCSVFYYIYFVEINEIRKEKLSSYVFISAFLFLSYLTHITNLIFFGAVLFYFCFFSEKNRVKKVLILIIIFASLFLSFVYLISVSERIGFIQTLKYMFGYGNKTGVYVKSGVIKNVYDFALTILEVFTAKYKFLAIILIFMVCAAFAKYKPAVKGFEKFLIIYLIFNAAFFSQWDVRSNIKLKIIFIPAFLILINCFYSSIKKNPSKPYILTNAFIIFIICVTNFKFVILPYSDIKNNELYGQAALINKMLKGKNGVLIDCPAKQIRFSCLTYFNDRIEFADSSEKNFLSIVDYYKINGYVFINWKDINQKNTLEY